jgi:hypothetical protein
VRNPVKKIALVVLLLSAFVWAGTPPKPGDYTINVHVSKSYFGERGEQMVKAVIDGKKYEMAARPDYPMLLALGDYKAKLVKDQHRGTYSYQQEYEFLFSDQKTKKFRVVGQTE